MSSVDVVIPCYRYGDLLPDTVRTVLEQPGVDVRVLIIDDASGDGSADVARRLAEEDPRVEASVHEQNKGHIATFNEGVLDWAEAEYTLLISADDVLTPGALGRAVEMLDDNPGMAFVYGNAPRWETWREKPAIRTGTWKPIVHKGHDWIRGRYEQASNPVYSPTVVARTELQQEVGGYNPKMLHTSDLEMWLKLALHGDVGFVSGVDQGLFRVHEQNMSSAYYHNDHGLRDFEMRLLAFDAVLEQSIGILPNTAELDKAVRRRLAREALLRLGRAYDRGERLADDGAAMIEFARRTAGDLSKLPEWHTLRLRRALGPTITPMLRPLVLTAAVRRLRQRSRDERLLQQGC
ncbi:glycosyltransferase family 2 protein [Actinomycetes bacterium KLBMP 9759]